MTFPSSNTVEQMILDAATSLGSGAGSSVLRADSSADFKPRISRIGTKASPAIPFLFVEILAIRGSNSFLP